MSEGNHRTTERVLEVLEILAKHNNIEGLSFSDISRELGIPKGSLHPLLLTLCKRNYVVLSKYDQKYHIGEALFTLGRSYISGSDLISQIEEVMEQVVRETKETCFVGVLSGKEAFYLLKKNAPGSLQVTAVPGYRLPAYCTGLGKALLSEKGLEELKAMYPDGLTQITSHTVKDVDTLYEQLKRVKETGFSYEREESSSHIQCIARPLRISGRIVAAISVAFPVFYQEETEHSQIKECLSKKALMIEEIINRNPGKWIYSDF